METGYSYYDRKGVSREPKRGETMRTYDFVQLVLHAAGQIQGRTKLQKLVYFAGELTGESAMLGYRPHYYGPYSGEVAAAVDDLHGLRFLDQKITSTGRPDPNGFEIVRYDYSLNEDGKLLANEKAKANPELWELIQEAVKLFNSTDYVKLSLAAKTYFMLGQAHGKSASLSELEAVAAKFGWKVTNEQVQEARRLLESTGFIHFSAPK